MTRRRSRSRRFVKRLPKKWRRTIRNLSYFKGTLATTITTLIMTVYGYFGGSWFIGTYDQPPPSGNTTYDNVTATLGLFRYQKTGGTYQVDEMVVGRVVRCMSAHDSQPCQLLFCTYIFMTCSVIMCILGLAAFLASMRYRGLHRGVGDSMTWMFCGQSLFCFVSVMLFLTLNKEELSYTLPFDLEPDKPTVPYTRAYPPGYVAAWLSTCFGGTLGIRLWFWPLTKKLDRKEAEASLYAPRSGADRRDDTDDSSSESSDSDNEIQVDLERRPLISSSHSPRLSAASSHTPGVSSPGPHTKMTPVV